MDLEATLERYHLALVGITNGDPNPLKQLYSHAEDVTLANPWGPACRGWRDVAAGIERAASNFLDGGARSEPHTPLALFVSDQLAVYVENERWQARVGGSADLSDVDLRVTSVFRRENDDWKVVHRHADPITRPNPAGVLGYQPDS